MQERILNSEAEMRKWASEMALGFEKGQVVLLKGELGAGKTTWARGALEGLEAKTKAKSPTFTILREHETSKGKVLHLDLYRLGGWEEVQELGWPEILEGFELILVEWPERLEGNSPPKSVELDFEVISENKRKVKMKA